MISQTFVAEYLKLFFPDYESSHPELLDIINEFAEPFLHDIIDNSYDGIYITDASGKTLLVNKA